MLERFSPEEIEQLMRELNELRNFKVNKKSVLSGVDVQDMTDVLFPYKLRGEHNISRNNKTQSIMVALTDAILGNYVKTPRGVAFGKTIANNQKGNYRQVYTELSDALRTIYDQHAAERETNIAVAFAEGEKNTTSNPTEGRATASARGIEE